MKSLRNSFLTLLALTLFGGAGAWAQGPTQVTQFTTDMLPDSWEGDDNDLTLADLQALGFGAVDASVAQAWTGAPQDEFVVLIYGFDGTYFNYITFDNGNAGTPSQTGYSKSGFYVNVAYSGTKHFYTSAPAAIELTKSGANQWSLGQTPDYDLELQVEYYEAHALKNIPAGWTVKINGVEQQTPYQGDSLMITETDSVTLIPTDPRRVKSVTLQNDVSYITVAGLQLIGKDGDSWATIRDNNPDKIDLVSGYVIRYTDGAELKEGEPSASCGSIDSVNSESSNYNAETESHQEYHWCQSN